MNRLEYITGLLKGVLHRAQGMDAGRPPYTTADPVPKGWENAQWSPVPAHVARQQVAATGATPRLSLMSYLPTATGNPRDDTPRALEQAGKYSRPIGTGPAVTPSRYDMPDAEGNMASRGQSYMQHVNAENMSRTHDARMAQMQAARNSANADIEYSQALRRPSILDKPIAEWDAPAGRSAGAPAFGKVTQGPERNIFRLLGAASMRMAPRNFHEPGVTAASGIRG